MASSHPLSELAHFTTAVRHVRNWSQPYCFPRWARSFSFSLQKISKMSESARRSWGTLMVKGFVNILEDVEGHFDIHVPEVAAVEAFDDAHGFAMGMAHQIEPGLVVEPGGFHHERVPLPFPNGVAEPGGLCHFLGKLATIGVDLAIHAIDFVHDDEQAG